MKTLYLDIFSGISGDMFLGAVIDLGVDPSLLNHQLARLPVEGYHLHVGRRRKGSIEGVKFEVHLHQHEHAESSRGHHHHHHAHDDKHSHDSHSHEHDRDNDHEHDHDGSRDHQQIKELIDGSTLSEWVKQRALAVFERIAQAEGKIHGMPPEKVHFHEVGAVDSIVDIVGACVALEMLGKPRVLAAPVVEGSGWIQCAHGRFPVPAPATLSILGARGIPLTQCEEPHELVTPTGAALLAEFVESFGPMRGIVAEKVGFGIGTRDNKTRPNVLRAILGTTVSADDGGASRDWEKDTIAVLETNLDDISPEMLGYFVEKAFADGALDVFHTPIQMKKNRPGTLLTVLCLESESDRFTALLMSETSAFGVRRTSAERRKLKREWITVQTAFGDVSVKIGKLDGKIIQASPEYESCKELAARAQVPLKLVYEAAMKNLPQGNP